MSKLTGKYAWTVTVGEKGQIVIPKQARDIFNIKPCDNLIVLRDNARGLAIRQKKCSTYFPKQYLKPVTART